MASQPSAATVKSSSEMAVSGLQCNRNSSKKLMTFNKSNLANVKIIFYVKLKLKKKKRKKQRKKF